MNTYIYPYNEASATVGELAKAIPAKRIKRLNSLFRPTEDKTVINWGSSTMPQEITNECRVFNRPYQVSMAINKLETFRALDLERVSIPEYTDRQNVAENWLVTGHTVIGRVFTNASGGKGIIILEPGMEVPKLPLYTKYIKKSFEYRVHVVGQSVCYVQRKALRRFDVIGDMINPERANWKIRNIHNNFVYVRQPVDGLPNRLLQLATLAVDVMGLDFGAVDIIYNAKHDKFYVLEVNTAPGLKGGSIEVYTAAFANLLINF